MSTWQNNIPLDWKIELFSNIAELRHGYQFRHYDFTEVGVKVFKITQIKGDGLTDISSCSYIDANRLSQFNRFVINKGDILIALTGATIGKIARYSEDEIVLQNYRVGNFFPIDENILLKEYLFQFLKSDYFYNQIIAGQTQSAQQNIGKEDINNMSVILPNIKEQLIIASILSVIDDKIELNLQMNKTLEEMAMALYKHWFVDFGPFQDGELVDSELGLIPKGWEVKRLDYILEIKYGKDHKKLEVGKIPVYGSGGIMRYVNQFLYDRDSILIPRKGTLSNLFYLTTPFWSVDTMFYSKIKQKHFGKYVFYFLKTIDLASMDVGSAVPSLTTELLNRIDILVPPTLEIERFDETVTRYFNIMESNIIENKTLTTLRDTLLPKLISGEVRVKEAEEILEEVL